MAHISVNGFKIIQNLGLKRRNTINYREGVLSSGKTYHGSLGNLSEEISFESILTLQQLDNKVNQNNAEGKAEIKAIHNAYLNLVSITKKKVVPIVIVDDISKQTLKFNGRVVELDWEMPVEYSYNYSWLIREDAEFKATIEDFNTFNYKSPSVSSSKNAKTNLPSWVSLLYKCNMKHDCGKYKVKCVYYLQRLLRTDGYYRNYKHDGWWCTYTTQELKKWQKNKAKVKVTGKWDDASKAYLKKRALAWIKKNSKK